MRLVLVGLIVGVYMLSTSFSAKAVESFECTDCNLGKRQSIAGEGGLETTTVGISPDVARIT